LIGPKQDFQDGNPIRRLQLTVRNIDIAKEGDYPESMTSYRPEIVVVLAAGLGSRIQSDNSPPKPLIPVAGRPLILRVLDRFREAGIDEAVLVLGHRADEIRTAVEADAPMSSIHFALNPRYRLGNGLSVLQAEEAVGERPFFLSMADHIFDADMIRTLAEARLPQNGLILAVDRKLDSIYDMDDATKVKTEEGHIMEIAKNLSVFDAVDTGLFSCSKALFRAIWTFSESRQNGDCSLSEGVHTLSKQKLALVHDIGDALWQDVDTMECAKHAETIFGNRP
jgi:1L-myo-inositol 1-phosphate cytidylyltransferase